MKYKSEMTGGMSFDMVPR